MRPSSELASSRTKIIGYGAFCIAVVVGIFALVSQNQSKAPNSIYPSPFSFEVSEGNKTQPPTIIFTTSRTGYEPLEFFTSSKFTYEHLKEHVGVIEPYVPNQINIMQEFIDEAVSHTYTICSRASDGQESECITGLTTNPFNIECDAYQLEMFDVVVSGYNSDSELVSSGSGSLLCQYVRREIRKLSEEDLSSTLDAMHALSVYTDEEGSALFGNSYSSAKRVVEMHYYNAAQQDSDHIHEGNGFLLQHLKITNLFDTSMQSVDPSVVLPYWDFTLDSGLWKKGRKNEVESIFSEKMFGNVSLATDSILGFSYKNDPMINARIQDGRWADLETDQNTRFSELMYGYGYLRAPWNMNPSPYISRFSSFDLAELPGCDSHYKILGYTDMMEFFYSMSFAPHGSTHGILGGVYGCDKFQSLYDQGYIQDSDDFHSICVAWITTLKELYRSAKITPKSGCVINSDDIQSSKCGFSCGDENKESIKLKLKSTFSQYAPSDVSDSSWDDWTDFLCDGDGATIFAGDHLEAASPADPSFWVIHPTLERLLHAKLMSSQGFETDSWSEDPRKESVCDHHECYELSISSSKEYYAECCDGHFSDSKLLDFINGDRCSYIGMTNEDIFKKTDPRSKSYSMPYIYADFNWDHCNQNFNKLLFDSTSTDGDDDDDKNDDDNSNKNKNKKGPTDTDTDSSTDSTVISSSSSSSRRSLKGSSSTSSSGSGSGGGPSSGSKPAKKVDRSPTSSPTFSPTPSFTSAPTEIIQMKKQTPSTTQTTISEYIAFPSSSSSSPSSSTSSSSSSVYGDPNTLSAELSDSFVSFCALKAAETQSSSLPSTNPVASPVSSPFPDPVPVTPAPSSSPVTFEPTTLSPTLPPLPDIDTGSPSASISTPDQDSSSPVSVPRPPSSSTTSSPTEEPSSSSSLLSPTLAPVEEPTRKPRPSPLSQDDDNNNNDTSSEVSSVEEEEESKAEVVEEDEEESSGFKKKDGVDPKEPSLMTRVPTKKPSPYTLSPSSSTEEGGGGGGSGENDKLVKLTRKPSSSLTRR